MSYDSKNTKLIKNNKRDVINFALETNPRFMSTKCFLCLNVVSFNINKILKG